MEYTQQDHDLINKWSPVLEGIEDQYTAKVTAILCENQAKQIIHEKLNESGFGGQPTTVGALGTYQKFAFPLVRRIYPELLANKICGVQPMSGPVSQIFYLGHTRTSDGGTGTATSQNIYSKYNLTYRGLETAPIDSGSIDLDTTGTLNTSDLLTNIDGSPSTTFGGKISSWPDERAIYGFNVSAGELLSGSAIPELNFHIEQQAVQARTRKMRALWTLEASQDLKSYHNLNLEQELTDLLSKELKLEIDRELIEDIRMIAYDVSSNSFGGFSRGMLDSPNSNNFGSDAASFNDGDFTAGAYTYDQGGLGSDAKGSAKNVFMIDLATTSLPFAPQHAGHTYANLLAVMNLASQDIYKTTHRGPGTWLLTSPIVGAMLESAAKLEGGIAPSDRPTNMGSTSIEYKGKFAGKYDLFIDPLYPEDEILMGYKGSNAMDAGFVYAPYIPLQQLPLIHDPESFQPRKGILTRYGKAVISPASRFYRIIRIVGTASNYLQIPFRQVDDNLVL